MKRKARIQTGIDDRLVAIYARKSRITNKGDSIGVQFKQSADYAINQLSLPEDYEFARYEDKGLSGYYSDRPDFQRLLRDIEMGKIKAVACYKLDRISRKTSDLMRLLEYFERHDVTLLVCSNNINTRISTSKIIIQVLAIIAEFERDILTERIQDNLMELAKDGRWLGGKTPTGFSSQRVTTGSGKNKSAISFLVPVQEEKEIVLEIYGTFWETRSLLQTANIINEKYETKHGAKFTTSTIRLILRNPIYCVADEYSYNYFLEHDGNLFGEPSDFDGQHGLTAYNKTDQMKVEDEDSTFFNPKFSQLLTRKPISEWIVSVGRHEGFISSRKWVETQNMLDEIAEKYNRPHRKTNALLSGLMYCPICGKRLRVLPESNRWTNGKPRFKYACPGVRAKECTFKGVEGVTLDEFVIHSLSSLQEEHSDYYRQLLENRVASMIRTDQSEKEYQETKKAIERLNADIAAQVRNLREADDALKRFIQDDIKELTDELAKREAALRRMEDTQSENQYLIHELNGMKKRLLSFEEFAKGAQPEALFTLVHSIVDRIYITTDGTKQKCQVYIKGCATEDYSDVLGAAGYIEEEPLLPVASYVPPMCDLDYYSIIDVVMHNAAVIYIGNVEEISSADWDKSYRVNFRAPLLLTQLFLPQMRSRNAGTIVFVPSSGAAPYMGAYEVFKTAQVELCNTLSGELEGTDVFTYSIGPGLVKTDTAMHGIEMVAQKMGLTTEEFYAMNDSHMLSAREAGCGFAVSVLHAEKYNGQEIGSIQALMDCGLLSVTDSGNSDKAGKAQTDPAMIRKIIQIYKEQYNGWMERNIFERQWVLRDFKKTVGISAGQFQSDMLQQEKELTAESENGFTVYRDHFEKLKRYYQRQYKLLQGYEKNPDKRKEHSDAILSWIRMLDEIL